MKTIFRIILSCVLALTASAQTQLRVNNQTRVLDAASTPVAFPQGGLLLRDTDSTNNLIISNGDNLSADRTLIFNTLGNTSVTFPTSGTLLTSSSLGNFTISTTAPLMGGGPLGNMTLSIPPATGSVGGYLTSTDWTTFNSKQPAGSYLAVDASTSAITGPGNASLFRGANGLGYSTASDVTNSINVAAWGDSLTHGAGPSQIQIYNYPAQFTTKTGYYVFNGGVDGETSTQIKTRMLAASSRYGNMTVIWAGRNNYTSSSTVQSDIAAMVAALGHDRYIVMSIINGNYSTEWSGTTNYNTILALNSALSSTYGSHYIDVRSYLISLYNPALPQDVIDHGHDVPPTSLRQGTAVSATITRSGSTATIVTSIAHGLLTGGTVLISGATQTEYNGLFTVTVLDTTTYTVTVAGTPATPATGTPLSALVDPLHLNGAGYLAVSNFIYASLPILQGTYGTVVTPSVLPNYFATPPALGATTPNTVSASTLSVSGAATIAGGVTSSLGGNVAQFSYKAGTAGSISGYMIFANANSNISANVYGDSTNGLHIDTAGNASPIAMDGSAVNISSTTNISKTTPASSATVGALVIGNGTAATSVAIGGGNINAGATITGVTGSLGGVAFSGNALTNVNSITGSSGVTIGNGLTSTRGGSSGAFSFTTGVSGTTSGYIVIANANAGKGANLYGDTTYGLHIDTPGNASSIQIDGSAFGVSSPVNFSSTTNAASSITGALKIGNGTAATNVGIGAGNINAGGNVTVGGNLAVTGNVTLTNALTVANGGTGQTTFTNGQLLIGNTTNNTLTKATLTAGAGITVTNGTGTITIANSASVAATETYGAGTAYTLTATPAAVDFGTTDPSITIATAGTYTISGQVNLFYNAATFAGNQTATLTFRRTNNTPANLTNGTVATTTQVITALTYTYGVVRLPDISYTASAGDVVTIYADISATPGAGSFQAVASGTFIRAKQDF